MKYKDLLVTSIVIIAVIFVCFVPVIPVEVPITTEILGFEVVIGKKTVYMSILWFVFYKLFS